MVIWVKPSFKRVLKDFKPPKTKFPKGFQRVSFVNCYPTVLVNLKVDYLQLQFVSVVCGSSVLAAISDKLLGHPFPFPMLDSAAISVNSFFFQFYLSTSKG